MTQDERLVPARPARDLDRTLAELTQSKGYGKGYGGRYSGGSAAEVNLKEYLFVVLKRKWLIMSLVLIITSLATIQAYREPSIYEGATTIKIEQKTPSILQSGNGGGIVIGQSDPNFWGRNSSSCRMRHSRVRWSSGSTCHTIRRSLGHRDKARSSLH